MHIYRVKVLEFLKKSPSSSTLLINNVIVQTAELDVPLPDLGGKNERSIKYEYRYNQDLKGYWLNY